MRYIRITKKEAYRRWESLLPVYLCPCRLRPDNLWAPAIRMVREDETCFEDLVNMFEFYNCDNERGRYTHFYITDREPVNLFDHRIYEKCR